ncbi:hypothetical protein LXL04_034179 [Taraxacum kok-saghyz]
MKILKSLSNTEFLSQNFEILSQIRDSPLTGNLHLRLLRLIDDRILTVCDNRYGGLHIREEEGHRSCSLVEPVCFLKTQCLETQCRMGVSPTLHPSFPAGSIDFSLRVEEAPISSSVAARRRSHLRPPIPPPAHTAFLNAFGGQLIGTLNHGENRRQKKKADVFKPVMVNKDQGKTNKDDANGSDNLSAVDILSACNLVNYFGKMVLGGSGVGGSRTKAGAIRCKKDFMTKSTLGQQQMRFMVPVWSCANWKGPEGIFEKSLQFVPDLCFKWSKNEKTYFMLAEANRSWNLLRGKLQDYCEVVEGYEREMGLKKNNPLVTNADRKVRKGEI